MLKNDSNNKTSLDNPQTIEKKAFCVFFEHFMKHKLDANHCDGQNKLKSSAFKPIKLEQVLLANSRNY
jgi:hypothetical protein